MTKQLYEEALADVKKLKEVAEDNAKRALLEAVTPRIRDLIENQLLGELGEIEADPEDILKDVTASARGESDFEPTPSIVAPQSGGASLSASSAISPPDEMGKVTLDLDSLNAGGGCENEYELNLESANSLSVLVSASGDATFDSRMSNLEKKIDLVNKAGNLVKETKSFEELLSSLVTEVEDTYSYLQNGLQDSPKKSSYESILENYYSTLKQLTEQKMKTQKTLSEAEVTLKLTGMPDDLDLESLGVDLITGEEEEGSAEDEAGEGDADLDLGGSEEEDEASDEDSELDFGDEEEDKKEESKSLSDDTVVEIDEGMLRREIARMKSLREAADMPKNSEKGHGPGEVADGFEDDDLGDPFEDGEVTTEGDMSHKASEMGELDQAYNEMDEMDQAYGEVDEMEEMEQSYHQATDHSNEDPQTNKKDRMPNESLRRRIDAEIKLQVEAKKKAAQAKKGKQVAEKEEKQAKTQAKKQQAKKQAKKMQEAYNFYATKFNESVARSNKLKGMLAEATRKGAALNGGSAKSAAETNLRSKLAETNLFNAKLLFTNKLLQNESLTKRQKAEIIERLDEAKSEREVKLVYESLVKTLSASTSKITESTDRGVIGSASRPARPAAATNALNEGFEADRWARLAGIVK